MNQTDFLFAKPSFLGGMSATLDLGATLVMFNESKDSIDADARAIGSDWIVTGNDIRSAMGKIGKGDHVE